MMSKYVGKLSSQSLRCFQLYKFSVVYLFIIANQCIYVWFMSCLQYGGKSNLGCYLRVRHITTWKLGLVVGTSGDETSLWLISY